MKISKKARERLDRVKNLGWQTLDLKNCGLQEIPEEVFGYIDLVIIDLSNDSFCDDEQKNKITVIPEGIANLKKLSRLNLGNNISHCTRQRADGLLESKVILHCNKWRKRFNDGFRTLISIHNQFATRKI